jgi:hypothetical protein
MPYAINSGENLLFKFALIALADGLTWKGLYVNTTAYIVDDAVLGSDNNGYKCILAGTGHAPPNVTYWTVLPPIPAANIADVAVELVDVNGNTVVAYGYTLGVPQTSGTLVVGQRYIITDFNTGDDFTNVGATNVTGSEFVATADTPTVWTNGSAVNPIASPPNIILTDGLLQIELLRGDTKPLDGNYELRTTISFANPIYVQSGAQTDVLCLPDAITITPC